MFSSRIKLALCVLHELAREKETGKRLTIPGLKQRLGALFTTRDGIKVVRDLCNASLAGYEWKDDQPNYFYSEDVVKASLFDLVIAVEGRAGLGEELGAGYFLDLAGSLAVAAHIEERLSFETGEALKKIPLACFLPQGKGRGDGIAGRRKGTPEKEIWQCEKCENSIRSMMR